jgi:probable F420-dependent oxidoreductase
MLVTILHPLAGADCDPELFTPHGMTEFARVADESGYDAVAFTEHPAPPQKWLDTGGHGSLDPLTTLAYCAAVTTRIRLMTYLLVLPYHSPLETLKAATTIDNLSNGRLTLTAGNGYLASEFKNLGLDFDTRIDAFDDSLDVLKQAWGQDTFSYEGRLTTAREVGLSPRPVQASLPILIGGNSGVARRRAARVADGWSPLVTTPERSASNRMAAITSVEELRVAVAKMREMATEAGRDADSLMVQTDFARGETRSAMDAPVDQHLELLAEVAAADVQSIVLRPTGSSLEACLDELRSYAADVLPQLT